MRAALDRGVDPCSIATGVPISLPDMGLILERIEELTCGVGTVRVEVDHGDEWLPDMMAATARRRLRAVRPLEAGHA